MRTLLFGFVLALAILPLSAQAAPTGFFGPIIPEACKCENDVTYEGQPTISAPAYGCILQTLQNGIRLLISLGFVAATLALMYAGFVWMTAGPNAERRSQGKNVLLNTLLGIFIMLTAWLIVDFVMKTLYREPTGFGPWNNILAGDGARECLEVRDSQRITDGSIDTVRNPAETSVSNPINGTRGCPSCVRLEGFACTNNCTADPALRDRLVRLVQTFQGTWVVTEAYPPTFNHSNQCHVMGTCIDAAFRSPTNYSTENIRAFHAAAQSAGLRVVFETDNCQLRNAARAAGVRAYCREDGGGYERITGTHFSVYGN